jgi:hypothetical protein
MDIMNSCFRPLLVVAEVVPKRLPSHWFLLAYGSVWVRAGFGRSCVEPRAESGLMDLEIRLEEEMWAGDSEGVSWSSC